MKVSVSSSGTIHSIYQERVELASLGIQTITRASEVEPTSKGAWLADLTRSGGPILGPFPHRSQAIDAEIGWLEAHLEKITLRTAKSK